MLFTWSTQDLCIVFRGWHVHDTFSLIWTLLAIVALTAGYEGVRELSRRYETETAIRLEEMPRKSFSTFTSTTPHIRKWEHTSAGVRQIRGG
jgi:solute carrier family 31 (copper transporter), member 1